MTNLSVRQAGMAEPVAASSTARKTVGTVTQSFMNELSRTLVETRSKPGIEPRNTTAITSSQTNVKGQNSVAASNPIASAIGFNALVPKTSSTVQPAVSSAPAPTDTVESADDAYWAKQPDYSQRANLAAQLASEGYSIDTPVMVWGWDPSATTQLRQQFGYTWVPSAMQPPVTAAPGISGGGIVPYDPANPPAGSIEVQP